MALKICWSTKVFLLYPFIFKVLNPSNKELYPLTKCFQYKYTPVMQPQNKTNKKLFAPEQFVNRVNFIVFVR